LEEKQNEWKEGRGSGEGRDTLPWRERDEWEQGGKKKEKGGGRGGSAVRRGNPGGGEAVLEGK